LHLIPDMIALSFLNNVLPARAGELLFPLLMKQRHQVAVGQSLALLLIARIFDFLAVSSLFLIFTLAVQDELSIGARQVILTAAVVLTPSLILLATLPWLSKSSLAMLDWLLHRLGVAHHRLGQWVHKLGERAVTAFIQVHHPRRYLKTFIWSIAGWLCTFAWFAAFLKAFDLPTPYALVVVGATFATLAKAIPFITVGGFGAHDAGWAFGFRQMGMDWQTAVASGLAVNILTLFASAVCSAIAFGYIHWQRQNKLKAV
ncbi:MAG: flippase-like domain-containing protein, partial [Chloroflexi bacterium]|nr:flippase-like domain-containing protein [Chloroflexota bacterium]